MKRVTLPDEACEVLKDIISDMQKELDAGGQKRSAAAYGELLEMFENAEDV